MEERPGEAERNGGQPTPPTAEDRRKEIEAWWALIARILAFFLGAVILAYQTFSSTADGVVLILVSAGLMGPMVAAGVAQVLSSWRGGGPGGG